MKFFSVDSPLYKFMNRLMDVFKLNCMWLLCSLPIVTMGAATTAAYTITLKMVKDEEGYIAGPFWKEFKANLKKGSILGVIGMVASYAVYLDFQLYHAAKHHNIMFWQNSISGSASGDRDGDHYVESDNYVCRSFNWTGMYHFHDQRFCQYVLRGHRERKSHG